ncbi:MAG TPA: CPBP family glutamic-type intramembrane protease [Salinimicrobium sp.]|nr:CPBP family glutamic-type intramembrane protease [Salinimicrobium sp.]
MNFKKIYHSRQYKIFELLGLYIAVPLLLKFYILEGWLKIIPLILLAIFFAILLLNDETFDKKILYSFNIDQFKKSLLRLFVITILVIAFTWWFYTYLLFDYIEQEPIGFLITFFLYPVASVIPQELIYRVYFFHRFPIVFRDKLLLIFANAFIFGFTHLIYANWVAPITTFLASILFIYNYRKSKTLLNVSFEHYVYGIILFAVGLGYFFH